MYEERIKVERLKDRAAVNNVYITLRISKRPLAHNATLSRSDLSRSLLTVLCCGFVLIDQCSASMYKLWRRMLTQLKFLGFDLVFGSSVSGHCTYEPPPPIPYDAERFPLSFLLTYLLTYLDYLDHLSAFLCSFGVSVSPQTTCCDRYISPRFCLATNRGDGDVAIHACPGRLLKTLTGRSYNLCICRELRGDGNPFILLSEMSSIFCCLRGPIKLCLFIDPFHYVRSLSFFPSSTLIASPRENIFPDVEAFILMPPCSVCSVWAVVR